MSNQLSTNTGTGWALEPSSAKEAYEMAKYISESGLCPKDFAGNAQKILVAAAMGTKLGLDVFASMAGIAVINGRPSLWGDVMRSLILSHPHLQDIDEHFEGEGDDLTAVCTITRKGMSPYTATFSVQNAKDAGLWGKNTWKGFSKDMLVNRAFGRAGRRRFADALNGFHVAEEMQDAEKAKPVDASVQDTPQLNISEHVNTQDVDEEKVPEPDHGTLVLNTDETHAQEQEEKLPTAQELNDAADAEIAEDKRLEELIQQNVDEQADDEIDDDGFGGPVQ